MYVQGLAEAEPGEGVPEWMSLDPGIWEELGAL